LTSILVLQHIDCEPIGIVEDALVQRDLTHTYSLAEPVPHELGCAAGLIVMGGPMSVYEQVKYPYLTDEMRLIELALAANLPILGICLGSQLLAQVLGSDVRPGTQPEIGWYEVSLSSAATQDRLWANVPREFMGFHWHGDTYSLPHGAVGLAHSTITPCQAFRYGEKVYGVQFHMEVTEAIIRDWTSVFDNSTGESAWDAEAILVGMTKHLAAQQEIGRSVFSRWAELVESAK
jgi:GMP synthase (glutamine-hydrolysing)